MDCQTDFQTISFVEHDFVLDCRWRHERQYLEYIKSAKLNGPIAIDVWAFSHFVNPGETILDAGANIGFTTLLGLRQRAGSVHSFEPDPRFRERLTKLASQESRLSFYPIALGEKSGEVELSLSTSHNQGSTLSDLHLQIFPKVYQDSEKVRVPMNSIDEVFDLQLDFMKVDVEGAEYAALKGAEKLLRTNPPPTIYVELYDQYFQQVHDLLSKYYSNVYRIVCTGEGEGRLFPLDAGFGELESNGLTVGPPSFIYSLEPREDLTGQWTAPKLD